MKSQNQNSHDFEERLQIQTGQFHPLHQADAYDSVLQNSTPKTKKMLLPFKFPEHTKDMSINKPIHDYAQHIKRNRHNIQQLPNDKIGPQFIDHLVYYGFH